MEDRRRRRVAFEKTAKRMLKYLEDSDDVKVGVTELQEQLEISEEAGTSIRQIAWQAMNENGQTIFEIFSKEMKGACIASLARWKAQLKGLVELERRCRDAMQEVRVLSERQDILKNTVGDKIRLQSRATEKYCDQIFEETKELEEKQSEEPLLLVQKRHHLWRYHKERDESRRLQRSGSSRRMKKEFDLQNLISFESCRSSEVDHVEVMSLESPRKMHDVQEAMDETAWKATRGRGEDAWRLEPEGETEMPATRVVSDGVEGIYVKLNGECHHAREQVKNSRRQSDAPGEEGVKKLKSPKRKIIRVESEETQDYVRETKNTDQEEPEELSFVPSAISVPL